MKKTITALLVLVMLLSVFPLTSLAAEPGRTIADPIVVQFGTNYTKTWTKDTDHLYWYNKVTVNRSGILNMTFTKPTDSEGELAKLNVVLYDEDSNTVWDSKCSYSVETASMKYNWKVGIPAGTYYLLVKPGFYVSSGVISTTYSFTFTATDYCELEPNESVTTATKLTLNHIFTGYYGYDGGNADDKDYFKFNATAGQTYRIVLDWAKFEPTTAMAKLNTPSNTNVSLSSKIESSTLIDDSGYPYFEFKAESSGWYYIEIYNYHKIQLEYHVGVFGNAGSNGWQQSSGKWYYYQNGSAVTGWQKINNVWYYFNNSGVMQTGWQKIGGAWYYFQSGGQMVVGWQKIGNVWYYFQSGGQMVTGWRDINGKTYYFKPSGAMAASEWCNGWWLNADGSWTYPYKGSWKQNSTGWWFGDTSGWYARNAKVKINDVVYTFNAAGYMV